MRVRNKRTGIEGDYPERQAKWLVSTGRCELVKPKAKPKPKAKQGYKTKDMKAETKA